VSRMYSRITAGTDYTFTLFRGAGVLWHSPSLRVSVTEKSLQGHTHPCCVDVAQHPRRISASFSNSLGSRSHQPDGRSRGTPLVRDHVRVAAATRVLVSRAPS